VYTVYNTVCCVRTQLMQESLDDARVLDADVDDDFMSDRHRCPRT